jgi:tape measure domain-containing protein
MEGGDLRVMAAIEERVVAMKFDGNQFLSGIQASLTALDKLNKGLKMQEGTKGLQNLGAAAQAQHGALKNVEAGIQGIADKFKAMGVVGMAALSNVTNQAIFAGQRIVKSLTLQPIMDGFREYETNINSIQTILSNTQAAGTKLKDVTTALDELNTYSDKTIYNFSEMAKNIGTFTAAGVGLKPAVAAIKGIANLAALSGSNSQQASSAMYQLSQAISSGRVSLEDWNSVVNAGMGGTVFKRALALNAEKMGTLKDGAVKLVGPMKNVTIAGKSFKDSITAKPGQESWLTSDVLTRTLSQFTGDLTDAQLAAQGFNAEEIKAIQSQAKMANNAATQVKTLSQLLGTIKERVGSGWAETWKVIFGDFTEAKGLFTGVSDRIGKMVDASSKARNKFLTDWKANGGRDSLISSLGNAFDALLSVIKPIKEAFRQIFPATTGKQLADMTKSIERFTANLKIGGTTANNLKRTFAGFFAVIDIGWTIVKEFVKTVFSLLGVATKGSGGFLAFTAGIGDWLVKVRDAIKQGDGIKNVFKAIGSVLAIPIKLIQKLAGFLGSLFKNVDGSAATKGIDKLSEKLAPLGDLGKVISTVWGKTLTVMTNVMGFLRKAGTWISDTFGGLGEQISNAFSGLNFKDILAGLNTGLFAGLLLMIKNLISGDGLGGIMENISGAFDNLTGSLGAMQNTLRAATLLQIAIAVGILAISMNVLSKIDAAGLARAGAAITVMFTQLLGAMLIFEKTSGFVGFAKMPFIAASMILLAAAVVILSSAVTKLAALDWNGLAKGLVGTTVLIGALIVAMKFMPNPAGMIASSIGLILLASAIKILASAVTDLSGLSWEELGKGLGGVAVLLTGLGLFTKFATLNKGGLLAGAGLLLLAAGIKILASAMSDFAGFSWGEIGRGLVAMAGSLTLVTLALAAIPPTAPLAAASVLITAIALKKVADVLDQMGAMSWGAIGKSLTAMLGALTILTLALTIIPPTAPLGAAGILIAAIALKQVADVLDQMGAMDWGSIGKAMVALGGSLLIIAIGVTAMTGALGGAAALLVVSAALAILTPVLVTLGGMSWGELGKGLLGLAAALTIIGIAGALLTPVIPTLLGLGVAVGLIGVGMALAGVGVLAFATGLAVLAGVGVAAQAAVVGIVGGLIGLIPKVVEAIGRGLILFAGVISTAGPAMTKAMTVVILSLLGAINKTGPKIIDTLYRMLTALVSTMNKYVPNLVNAGAKLIVAILNGIAKNIGKIVTAATDVIVAFIKGVSANQGRVIDAGVKLIISFVNGLAGAIRRNQSEMNAAGRNLAMAIIDGMTGGLGSGVGRIVSKAKEVASSALNAAKSVLGIASPSKEFEKIGRFVNDGFRKGLDGNKKQVYAAFFGLKKMLADLRNESSKDVDALEAKLKKLQKAGASKKKQASTKKALAQAKKEEAASKQAYNMLSKHLDDEATALGRLANRYDLVTKKLETAKQTLVDAIKTRDDYKQQVTDQYSDMASAGADTKLTDYIADLKKQVEDTKTFANAIQRLRSLGLNDESYKDLLAAGPAALPFVQELLVGGKGAVDEINRLGKELDSVGGSLGKSASTALYQAGVDAAAGLVKGLQNQQKAIEKQMDKIADAMVKAIKKKLGIKSPSRVFAQMGAYSAKGLAEGLDKSAIDVIKSSENLATAAVKTLGKSLSNMDKMTLGGVNMTPVIRPVLDLTDIQKNAGKINGLLPSAKMNVSAAYSNAAGVAADVRSTQGDDEYAKTASGMKTVTFTQNNYSPKALSQAEIYRNTKNQLSVAKGALEPNAR